MHLVVFYIAIVWLGLLFVASLLYMIRVSSTATRILVLDTMGLLLTTLLALFTRVTNNPFYLDAALFLALLAFISTLAAARYYQEGKLFT